VPGIAVAQDSAEAEFEQLFGAEVQRVVATVSKADDVELAATLLKAAGQPTTAAPMKAVLCRRAAELAADHPDGLETAVNALNTLAALGDEHRIDALDQLVSIHQRTYARARGEDRLAAGADLIDALRRLAEARRGLHEYDAALSAYRRANFVATAVRDNDLKLRLKGDMDQTRADQKAHERLTAVKARLKADPSNAQTARELVLLLLIDHDDPDEARKYTFLLKDETLKQRVPWAAGPIENVEEAQASQLGEWYEQLAQQAESDHARYTMLRRSSRYLARYLAMHPQEDLLRTKSLLIRQRVDDRLADLRHTLGLPEDPAPATAHATISPTPTLDPLPQGPGRTVDPAIQAWIAERDRLSGEELYEAVIAKLSEVNGGAAINVRSKRFNNDGSLRYLYFQDNPRLKNIDPLHGLPMTALYIRHAAIEDLEALRGMPLRELMLRDCPNLTSLAPLQGMSLVDLSLNGSSNIAGDLRALKGMPLRQLGLSGLAKLSSLSGIEGMKLTRLYLSGCRSLRGDLSALQGMTLERFSVDGCSSLTSLKGLENLKLRLGTLELDGCRSLQGDLNVFKDCSFDRVDLRGCESLESLAGLEGKPITRMRADGCKNLTVDFEILEQAQLTQLSLEGCKAVRNIKAMMKHPLVELNIDVQNKTGFKALPLVLSKITTLRQVTTGVPAADQQLQKLLRAR